LNPRKRKFPSEWELLKKGLPRGQKTLGEKKMSKKKETKKKRELPPVTMFIRLIKGKWGEFVSINIPEDVANGFHRWHACNANSLRELLAGERDFVVVRMSKGPRIRKEHALIFIEEE